MGTTTEWSVFFLFWKQRNVIHVMCGWLRCACPLSFLLLGEGKRVGGGEPLSTHPLGSSGRDALPLLRYNSRNEVFASFASVKMRCSMRGDREDYVRRTTTSTQANATF